MKTVLVLAAFVALSLASVVHQKYDVETKSVDAEFVARQKRILGFFHFTEQVNVEAEYYKIGKDYIIEDHVDYYTDKEAVAEWSRLRLDGWLPKDEVFTIFGERIREEAVTLYRLFLSAKDFETFYKTAAYARVYLNDHLFYYTFYMSVFQRTDTKGIIMPAPYEIFPEYFTNFDTMYKMFVIKMQEGLLDERSANSFGIFKEADRYVYYSNFSNYWTYGKEESRLAYFTEDIGWNTFYYYYHLTIPFWLETPVPRQNKYLNERRGELYYYAYQQMLSRYYLERLSNGLGEIPDFSWWTPLKTGYRPVLSSSAHPFIQRNDYYYMQYEQNVEDLQFLDSYEKQFLQFLQQGKFKAYDHEIDLRDPKAINFVGNYWQSNADLYAKSERNYLPSYDHIARRVLSAAPYPLDWHTYAPTALSFYETSARDPVFYQMYSKIIKYILLYKEHLEPYTHEELDFEKVEIKDVHVDRLVTFFDYFDFDASNAVYGTHKELNSKMPVFTVRQPRLNHKPFSINIDVHSGFQGDAVVKVFLGPKYDSRGFPIHIEDNWMNFYELDAFTYKLQNGENKIVRSSEEFSFYKEDSLPTSEFWKLIEQGKAPVDQSEYYEWMPKRLMLPRGRPGGFPYQLLVVVYPLESSKTPEHVIDYFIDSKPLGYPLDRPVVQSHFTQTNIFFEDVYVYHEGEYLNYRYNDPYFIEHSNEVSKH